MLGEASTIRRRDSGTALDTELPVTTGGDGNWTWANWPTPYYDSDATGSGDVDDYEESVMTTAGYGPGTVSFYWRVSSEEDYDYLEFYIDDVRQDRISGSSTSWQLKSYNVEGEGKHTFTWRYVKDGSSYDGNDRGYVDYLQWTGDAEPESSDWAEIEYTYDPSGRRIAKDVDGTVTKYVYDGDHCIAEYDGSNNLLRKYIYGPCIDEPICMIETTGTYADTYYYHYDALGSVVALSDSDGDMSQTYEYDVYGQVAASDPNHPNPFLFTGRRYDTETGFYYYRARYYNATIGRFLQTDPIGYEGGMNWYGYCANNSLNCVDPLGLDWTFGTGSNDLLGYYWNGDETLQQLTGTYNFQGVASEMGRNPATLRTHYIMDPCEPNKVIGILFYHEGPDEEFWEYPDNFDPTAGDREHLAVDVGEIDMAGQHGKQRKRFDDEDWFLEPWEMVEEIARLKAAGGNSSRIKKLEKMLKYKGRKRSRHSGNVKKIIYTTGGAIGEALSEAWNDPSLGNTAAAGGIVIGGTVIVIGAVVIAVAGGMVGVGS